MFVPFFLAFFPIFFQYFSFFQLSSLFLFNFLFIHFVLVIRSAGWLYRDISFHIICMPSWKCISNPRRNRHSINTTLEKFKRIIKQFARSAGSDFSMNKLEQNASRWSFSICCCFTFHFALSIHAPKRFPSCGHMSAYAEQEHWTVCSLQCAVYTCIQSIEIDYHRQYTPCSTIEPTHTIVSHMLSTSHAAAQRKKSTVNLKKERKKLENRAKKRRTNRGIPGVCGPV